MNDTGHKVAVVQAKDTQFVAGGLRPYLEYRDLGVNTATGGQYHAHVIRPTAPCPAGGTGKHFHDLDFQMNYVLKGWVKMWIEGAGEVRIDAGGCWLQPPSIPHSLVDYSEDAEWVEVTAPAAFGTKEM